MTANADVPLCEVCEERRAEGTFGPAANPAAVCRDCAACAIDDGHMAASEFEWWAARAAQANGDSGN